MVRGQHDVQRAVGPYLHAALTDLVYDVPIMPVEQGCDATHGLAVKLALAREGVWRVERATGTHAMGSRQSHTTPRAQGWRPGAPARSP